MPLQHPEHHRVLGSDIPFEQMFLRDPDGVPIEINFRN
jgi:hypothetical protein